jgi:polyhydroxybutyrate depolymerase
MKGRQRVLAAVFALLSVPLLVAGLEAVSFYLHHRNNGTLMVSGVERAYLLHVPESYDGSQPVPLMISLHGGAGWPALQRDVSRWNRLADRDGFLVVYPASLKIGGVRGWRVVEPGPGLDADVRFVSDLIDTLEARYNIDPARVYVNGLSNGGAMAFTLSCTLPHRIAAVGVVAPAQILSWEWCPDPEPIPWIAFYGTDDRLVPYTGGTSWASPQRPFPDALAWTARWAARNRCTPEPMESRVARGVTRRAYSGCAHGASVVLFTVEGGGHTWPGSEPLPEWFLGPTSEAIDATEQMWDFFRR